VGVYNYSNPFLKGKERGLMKKSVLTVSLGAAVLVGGLVGMATTASATVDSSVYIVHNYDTVTANNSLSGLDAVCDSGDTGYGGGFMVTNGVDVDVAARAPYTPGDSATPLGWSTSFINHDSVSRTVHVYAICKDT
jgi:hypothetical protein